MGRKQPAAEKAIATASTAVIWSPLPVVLRTSKCCETGKATSIPKCLTGIVETSLTLRMDATGIFVAGTSTRDPLGKWPKRSWESLPAEVTISRLNHSLTQQFETWRERPLQAHWRILYLDGVHFSMRHGDQADSTIILTALGVDLGGNKEVLALRARAEEDKEG
jgi:hypothetical protein